MSSLEQQTAKNRVRVSRKEKKHVRFWQSFFSTSAVRETVIKPKNAAVTVQCALLAIRQTVHFTRTNLGVASILKTQLFIQSYLSNTSTQRALLSSCHYNHFEQFYGQKSGNVTNQKLGVRHSITYLVLVMAHRGFLGFLNVGYEYI